jgi:hypothetical protein
MDDKEYQLKYASLRILKSIQEYLKTDDSDAEPIALYPIRVPRDLLSHIMRLHSAEELDQLMHSIFSRGIENWAEALYLSVFGTTKALENFIKRIQETEEDKINNSEHDE